ncbi:hypothetical protein PQR71_40195 [Paraburkholderia fungorum]|uniref:hypothetical protein n=1 Tax=Paraburkholderia fungorum TaxID=134537 RepID=UPI0038B89682
MNDTLYLDPVVWDLALDSSGNIALASAPYSLAQDCCSAIRTFLAECWYDQTIGISYWQDILGHYPSLALVKADLVAAAMTVPGVASAQVFITGVTDRKLSGQVQITDTTGTTTAASF